MTISITSLNTRTHPDLQHHNPELLLDLKPSVTPPETKSSKLWDTAKKYAGIIDSRESITRLVLDLTAFDIPVILAGATRNWSSFLEACLEATWSTVALFIAPL